MSFGAGGFGDWQGKTTSTRSSSSTTTPWTNIASQLASFLGTQLKSLGSGASISQGVQAIQSTFDRSTKQGIANIKESMGESGLRFSTDTGKAIGDFTTGQTTQESLQIQQFQQQAVQNQLSALQEIIQLGAGSQSSTGLNYEQAFGWGAGIQGSVGQSCWIAAAVYDGWDDPRTIDVREWLVTEFVKTFTGRVVMWMYVKFGRQTARLVKHSLLLKKVFKSLFDLALAKARS